MTHFNRTLRIDDGGDIFRDDSKRYEMIDGEEGVVQELKLSLKTIRGEQIFARNFGLRLFEITGATDAVLEREIDFVLSEDDRVKSVDSITVEDGDRPRTRNVQVVVTLISESQVSFGVTAE